jgi:hypothetical protein
VTATIKTLNDGRIILLTYGTSVTPKEIKSSFEAAYQHIENTPGFVHVIMDTTQTVPQQIPSNTLTLVSRNRFAPAHHPRCKTCNIVLKHMIFRALTETLNLIDPLMTGKLHTFSTVESAMSFVQQQVVKQST